MKIRRLFFQRRCRSLLNFRNRVVIPVEKYNKPACAQNRLCGAATMAWEELSASKPNLVIARACLSFLWIALIIAGAFLTNFDEPYLPFAVAGSFVFFLRSLPSRWEIYAWLLSSALFVKVIHLSRIPFWVLRISTASAVLGFGAILLLGLRAIWSEREARENAFAMLAPALILILFIFASANVLRMSDSLSPQTDDAWLYAFDGSLGFQPGFAVGRLMYQSLLLARSAMLTYLSLPFAMAVVCAWHIPSKTRRISWHMLAVLLLAGVSGWLLYNVVPGTGPLYAFGHDFPWHGLPYKDLSTFVLQKMLIPTGIPRNAMPSLHMGWAILLFWNSRAFPRALRAALLLYLALTVVATLGTGQHYLVDLVVSLPFALAVEAAASYTLPDKSRRFIALISGIILTLAWLLLVRYGAPLTQSSPVIPWTFIVTTLVAAIWLEHWMSAEEPAEKSIPAGTGENPSLHRKMARSAGLS